MRKKEISTDKPPRRSYDDEFKASAVQMVANGRSIADVSRSLGINANMLHKWRSALSSPLPTSTNQSELERLQRYVKQLEMERDILKKALSIFSR
jgi:transposase